MLTFIRNENDDAYAVLAVTTKSEINKTMLVKGLFPKGGGGEAKYKKMSFWPKSG